MTETAGLPDSLTAAVRNLEERLALLQVRARKVEPAEWDALPPEIATLVPSWIQQMLGGYAVAGAVLEARDPVQPGGPRLLSLFTPESYAAILADGELRELVDQYSLVPIANESDGSVWGVRSSDGAIGSVWLLEHSAWDGGMPGKTNGLRFAAHGLAHLLCSMAVSEASYYSDEGEARNPTRTF